MNKTEEILNLLADSATRSEQNGQQFIGRAAGIRDVIKFFVDNKLEIHGPEEPKADPENTVEK